MVDQGEGECMLYSCMHRLLKKAFDVSDEPVDCIFDLHSEDTDTFAGLSMYFAYSLQEASIVNICIILLRLVDVS